MASIVNRRNGTREIAVMVHGKRQTIRLGRCTAKQARAAKFVIEQLAAQVMTGGVLDDKSYRVLRDLDDTMHERLVRAGLTESRTRYTLGSWIDLCIEKTAKTAVPGTVTRLRQSERAAVGYFGKDRALHTITIGQAEDYETHIKSTKIAEATARKRLGDLKQWMGRAVKHRLIEVNPLGDIRTTVPPTANHSYISDEKARKVMEHLPTAVMRAAFALSRWGGLRTASEHARLRWRDIDWHAERFIVTGKGNVRRQVPIFPELVAPLNDLFEVTAPGTAEVFPGMESDSSYLRRAVIRAIEDEGLKVWPRLFHNLRASRQTDLIDEYGIGEIKTICSWLGNSPQVAIRNYMLERGRDDAFRRATKIVEVRAAECAAQGGETKRNTSKEKPADGPERHESGINGDPYGVSSSDQIVMLFQRIRDQQARGAAECAAVTEDAFKAAFDALGPVDRSHLFEVMKRLARENIAHA